jgi:hypothetical protein
MTIGPGVVQKYRSSQRRCAELEASLSSANAKSSALEGDVTALNARLHDCQKTLEKVRDARQGRHGHVLHPSSRGHCIDRNPLPWVHGSALRGTALPPALQGTARCKRGIGQHCACTLVLGGGHTEVCY